MNNSECYPSSGFDGVLQSATWQNLQTYLGDASHNLPKSPDPKSEAILESIRNAAVSFHSSVLPEANKLGNSVYNYAETMSATLKGLSSLMEQSSPQKSAIQQLLENLSQTAGAAQPGTQSVAHGLASFQSATASAGAALAARLAAATARISGADTTILDKAQDLKQQLTSSDLDTATIEADMQAILQAANQFKGVSLIGLTFSVAPGVSAAKSAAADINKLDGAWRVLIGQLGALNSQVGATSEDKLKQIPCLSSAALTTAGDSWAAIANQAHDFMQNFYVTPT